MISSILNGAHVDSSLLIFMINPFLIDAMISSMIKMMMMIILLALLTKIFFQTPKYWKMVKSFQIHQALIIMMNTMIMTQKIIMMILIPRTLNPSNTKFWTWRSGKCHRSDNRHQCPEQNVCRIWHTSNINYNYESATRLSMGWSKLIFGAFSLHDVAKSYDNVVNVINSIATFVEPNPSTNIITN